MLCKSSQQQNNVNRSEHVLLPKNHIFNTLNSQMTQKTITFNKNNISSVNIGPLEKYFHWCQSNKMYFTMKPGEEHYRLLAWISKNLDAKHIVDIGTQFGLSALALGLNEDIKVTSYDIFEDFKDSKISVMIMDNKIEAFATLTLSNSKTVACDVSATKIVIP